MTDHDGLFKKLLRTFFLEFVDVFLPEMAEYLERDAIEFLDKEVFPELDDKSSRRADLVAKARFQGQELFFLIHIESQAARRPRFNRRMFFYTAWLDKTFDLPVYPIALLTWDKPQTPDTGQFKVEFPDRRVLEFNYAVIQLNQLNWRDYRRRDNPAASALMAKMGVQPEERGKVMLACLRMRRCVAKLTCPSCRVSSLSVTSSLPLSSPLSSPLLKPSWRPIFMPVRSQMFMYSITVFLSLGLSLLVSSCTSTFCSSSSGKYAPIDLLRCLESTV